MCLYRWWQLITQCDLYGKNLTARHLHQCEMTCQNNVTWSERNKFINADTDDRQFFFLVVVVVFFKKITSSGNLFLSQSEGFVECDTQYTVRGIVGD